MNWWEETVDPTERDLARRICSGHGIGPDVMCVGYQPAVIAVPNGMAAMVREADLRPLWTCYVGVARLAIQMRVEQLVDQAVGPAADSGDEGAVPPAPTVPGGAIETWRRETGLDDPSEG